MSTKKLVLEKYPDACMGQIRGLKLFILEAKSPKSSYMHGIGYGETQKAAWEDALNRINKKSKLTDDGKYYFKQKAGKLLEVCNVVMDGTMIGSASCIYCPFCTHYDRKNNDWIICSNIKKATNT